MQLDSIPAFALDLNFVRLERDCGSDVAGLDVNAGDQTVGGQLVVRGIARSTHAQYLSIFGKGD